MIRIYEYEPRESVDEDGNIAITNAYRDFHNFIFSVPYEIEWDWTADKMVIHGIAYRISTIELINAGKTHICLCGGGQGGSGGGVSGISKIKTDRTLHGEGHDALPLGAKLSEIAGNRMQILDDGLYVGESLYIPPVVTLTASVPEGEYSEKLIVELTLFANIYTGSETIQSVRLMDGNDILHEFINIPDEPFFPLEYTIPVGLAKDSIFMVAAVFENGEYFSNTLTYTFTEIKKPDISFGEEDTMLSKYSGGTCIGGGKVVAIPNRAHQFLMIDTNNFTTTPFGIEYTQADKFSGSVYIGDGKIVAIPYSYPHPMLVDTHQMTITPVGEEDNATGKYSGGAYIGDGKVLAFQSSQGQSAIIDTSMNTVTKIGAYVAGANLFRGGVSLGNGKFLMIPFHATRFQIIDIDNETVTPFGTTFNGYALFVLGVYIGDGKVIAIPNTAQQFQLVDTNNLTVTPFGEDITGINKWSGGVYLGKDRILAMPSSGQRRFAIADADSGTITEFGPIPTSSIQNYHGAVYAGNNIVVAIALNAPQFAYLHLKEIGVAGNLPLELDEEMLLSPYFNKFQQILKNDKQKENDL